MTQLGIHKIHKSESISDAILARREMSSKVRHILLPDGHYVLDRTIQLDHRDSGLTIRAENPGNARLFGGHKITGWQPKSEKLWRAPLPRPLISEWDFRLLVVNGRMARRARVPKTGYLFHDTEFNVKWRSTIEGGWERPPTDDELLTLKYRPDDIGSWFDANNAEITLFHMWDESLVGVAAIDPDNHVLRFSNKPGYPPGAFAGQYDMQRRYVIWNIKEGLHQPGQWYLDRTAGEVVYWPLPGQDMRSAVALAPAVDTIVRLEGTPDQPIENIKLHGLDISLTNAPRKTGAFGAKLFDGAISIKNAQDCHLENLRIHNVAGHALKAHCHNLTISNCDIEYVGASAIRALGANISIHNNHIHHVGQIFPSAIAVYIGMTDPNVPAEWHVRHETHDARITHNELHDTPYTAIACGGRNHRIENNLIYRAMQDLYDGAGIYITFCEHVEVRGNYVCDIKKSAGAGTSAYYMDEKTIHSILEHNISVDVARPMHNHISQGNTIRNNVFIMPGKGYYTLERSDDYTFEKNILFSEKEFSLYDIRTLKNFNNNIFFCRKGNAIARVLDGYRITKSYLMPLGETNLECDPKIVCQEKGKILFLHNSPALALGIQPVDVSKAGRTNCL